jgi:hypothetical protein
MMHAIGLRVESAKNKHKIGPVSDFIEQACIQQVTRGLDSPTHALPASLRANIRTHHTRPLYPPKAKTEKLNNSAVMKTIRHINNTRHSKRQPPQLKVVETVVETSATTPLSRKPQIKCPTCPRYFTQISKQRCKGA